MLTAQKLTTITFSRLEHLELEIFRHFEFMNYLLRVIRAPGLKHLKLEMEPYVLKGARYALQFLKFHAPTLQSANLHLDWMGLNEIYEFENDEFTWTPEVNTLAHETGEALKNLKKLKIDVCGGTTYLFLAEPMGQIFEKLSAHRAIEDMNLTRFYSPDMLDSPNLFDKYYSQMLVYALRHLRVNYHPYENEAPPTQGKFHFV